MGTFIGHVAPGAGFFIIGLWHLYRTLLNFALSTKTSEVFESRPWFPLGFSKCVEVRSWIRQSLGTLIGPRYIELYLIIFGSCLSILSELKLGLHGRHALDDDWSIPWINLNNFEHSTISLFLLLFAISALTFDFFNVPIPHGLVHMLGIIAFCIELLIFHLHSADHMGLEGQYHWLLQLVIIVGIASIILEVSSPHNVLPPIVRSTSLIFQGVWFIQTGFIVFTKTFVPNGCNFVEYVVICDDKVALTRAKALANLQFSWWLAVVVLFILAFYVIMMKMFGRTHDYEALEQFVVTSNSTMNKEISMVDQQEMNNQKLFSQLSRDQDRVQFITEGR